MQTQATPTLSAPRVPVTSYNLVRGPDQATLIDATHAVAAAMLQRPVLTFFTDYNVHGGITGRLEKAMISFRVTVNSIVRGTCEQYFTVDGWGEEFSGSRKAPVAPRRVEITYNTKTQKGNLTIIR
jgi:hypothetical protein